MQNTIKYNNVNYRKHPKQEYYYCSQSEGKRQYSRCLHRQMWYDNNGVIPEGFHIHHKNGNALDNRIENFEIKKGSDHISEHSINRDPKDFIKLQEIGKEFAKEWHKSKEGKEWHKQNAINSGFGKYDYGKIKCNFCEREFTKKAAQSKFCSNNCKSAWRRKNNPDKITVSCLNCGLEYETLKFFPKKYCSKKCTPPPNLNGRKGK